MSESTPGQPAPLPYQEITDAQYAITAAKEFEVAEYGADVLTLRGPCPRCGVMIEVPIVGQVVRRVNPAADASQPEASEGEPVLCTCEEHHEGRPEGRVGCGAYWTFIL